MIAESEQLSTMKTSPNMLTTRPCCLFSCLSTTSANRPTASLPVSAQQQHHGERR